MASHDHVPLLCKHCQATFVGGENFIVHQICEGVRPLTCPDCESEFDEIDDLMNCYKSHPGETDRKKSKPPEDLLTFKNEPARKPIVTEVHSPKNESESEVDTDMQEDPDPETCTRESSHQVSFSEGKTSMQEAPQICSTLPVGDILLPKVKRFICSICDKGFGDRRSLTRHFRIHTGEKPYQCSICDKQFADTGALAKHTKMHMGEKPFHCTICGKKFSQKTHLTGHQRVHTGEKPFECSFCGRKFTNNSNLTVHKRVHTGEKPFQCPVCGEKFTQSSYLKVHIRTHTGEKPYSCSVCGKLFSRQHRLTSHEKTHPEMQVSRPDEPENDVPRVDPTPDAEAEAETSIDEDRFHCMERTHLLEHSYETTACGLCFTVKPGICKGDEQCEKMWALCKKCNEGLVLKSSQIITMPDPTEDSTETPPLCEHLLETSSCGLCSDVKPTVSDCSDMKQTVSDCSDVKATVSDCSDVKSTGSEEQCESST